MGYFYPNEMLNIILKGNDKMSYFCYKFNNNAKTSPDPRHQ